MFALPNRVCIKISCCVVFALVISLFVVSGNTLHAADLDRDPPCSDRFDECPLHEEDCTSNPGWMAVNCPKTCNFCHIQKARDRCSKAFLNISSDPFLTPGDVSKIFKRIISSASQITTPPSVTTLNGNVDVSGVSRQDAIVSMADGVEILSTKPYILKFPNFLSGAEVDELLAYPGIEFERSTESAKAINEVGEVNTLVSEVRTSSSFWCRFGCKDRDIYRTVASRIASLGNSALPPVENWEPFQFLKYQIGEYYRSHHDYSIDELQLTCGPRIFTFFIYLSDVEEGGNTSFPLTTDRISIMPKKGDAALWANVENKRPLSKDIRTTHEANVVSKGVKYGLNVWMHMYNWETANRWACSG